MNLVLCTLETASVVWPSKLVGVEQCWIPDSERPPSPTPPCSLLLLSSKLGSFSATSEAAAEASESSAFLGFFGRGAGAVRERNGRCCGLNRMLGHLGNPVIHSVLNHFFIHLLCIYISGSMLGADGANETQAALLLVL